MILELDKVSEAYQQAGKNLSREVLIDINLKINAGDSIAITGPSGSGKSSLLNIIGAIDAPSSGKVRYHGEDIRSLSDNALATFRNTHIGFIFQMHHLLPQLTALENILLPVIPQLKKSKTKEAEQKAMELLNSLGLADLANQRPGQMSGGECQRVAVARALINDPSIILADEPTGSLDQKSADQLGELLCDINQKHKLTMLVVTHSIGLANRMSAKYELINSELVLK